MQTSTITVPDYDTVHDTALDAVWNSLISALEQKHPYTKGHSLAVDHLTFLLATQLRHTWIVRDLEWLCIGARLHDIGKIQIDNELLDYTGPLSDQHLQVFRKHPEVGSLILTNTGIEIPQIVHDAILYHHESFNDNTGYPTGLRGEDIPLPGRIVAVADVFDALITKRSYKPAMDMAEATKILRSMAGIKLDPEIVDLFIRKVIPQIEAW